MSDEIDIPPDIQEFGIRHKIPEFSNATYRNGFMAGLREAAFIMDQTPVEWHVGDRGEIIHDWEGCTKAMEAAVLARVSALSPNTAADDSTECGGIDT